MRYFRSIFSSLILFLISIILVVNQSPIANGFETAGGAGAAHPWLHAIIIGDHLGLPVHQDITKDGLDFFNDDTKTLLADEHLFMESNQTSINHFDNCAFSGTINNINQMYRTTVSKLHPGATPQEIHDAAEQFGRLLHPVQDFYAHSNWVEMGRHNLVDSGNSYWTQIKPFSLSNGTNPIFSFEVERNTDTKSVIYATQYANKIIRVKTGENHYQDIGLVSGTYGDPSDNHCLPGASIPHGSSVRPYFPTNLSASPESLNVADELNKDNPKRKGFDTARDLATKQTTHEFCRLVSLTNEAWTTKDGVEGAKIIYDNWIEDKTKARSMCPEQSIPIALDQSSGRPIIKEQVLIPSWLKRNAQYWSDGSLTDKDFATGIGYLVQQKIISANVKTNKDGTILVNDNLSIPKWIKNNAKYWSEGSISDSDFKSGIEFMVNQNIISFSEPVQKQGVISNDVLKSLYAISKQYERTASSILTLNDNQEKVLQGLTTNGWNTNTQDPKIVVHAQVLDLLIKKQELDKQNIQKVLDTTSSISNKIKDYALKQGVSSSDLNKISSTPLKNQNTANDPISVLKQSADDVKNNVVATDNGITLTNAEKQELVKRLADILGSPNSPLEDFNLDKPDPNKVIVEERVLLDNDGDITTASEQAMLTRTLKLVPLIENFSQQYADDRSKQHVLDMIQGMIDLLQTEEQGETNSILNYVSDPSLKDMFASEGNPTYVSPIQLESKHGSYEPVGNSDTYMLYGSWVLKSQNGIEHKDASYHIFSSTNTYYNIRGDAKIEEGVIKASSGFDNPLPPGTWFLELVQIDGNLPPPDGSIITIVIPHKGGSSETPSTVQSTPPTQTTPLTQNTMDFSVPPQIVQEATSSSGAIVHFTISASSPGGNTGIVICVPSDGSQFPLGSTTVTCTATDVSSQKTLKKSFVVSVHDTTPPAISPFNPHNDTPDDSGAIVYFTMEAIDLVDGHVTPHCDHTSGSKFPLGSTIVTCTADDSKGNHSERKLGITITKS